MRIYDEENLDFDDDEFDGEMAGYSLDEENSIFGQLAPEKDGETLATPIPQNEQTVLLCEPKVAGLKDGSPLNLRFTRNDGCEVYAGNKKAGELKAAYVKKLKAERGGQNALAYFKLTVPPMARIVFGEGDPIPAISE